MCRGQVSPERRPKSFCLLVADLPRCWMAFELLLQLPAEGDSLKLIHIHEDVAAKLGEAEELKQKYEKYLSRAPDQIQG